MNCKKIFGLLLCILGLAFLVVAGYIDSQVKEGRKKISKAQKNLDTGTALFSLAPVTKDLSQNFSRGIQKKIEEGTETADYYEHLAVQFKVVGIILLVAGILVVIFCKAKKKSTKK